MCVFVCKTHVEKLNLKYLSLLFGARLFFFHLPLQCIETNRESSKICRLQPQPPQLHSPIPNSLCLQSFSNSLEHRCNIKS